MNLFERLSPAMVVREPFPHLLTEVEGAEELALCFPPLSFFGAGLPPARKVLRRYADLGEIKGALRRLLDAHVRREAFAHLVRLFGDDIRREYPRLEQEYGPLASMSVGRRSHDQATALLDAQLGVLAPARGARAAERGPHVKGPNKLIEAQLFLPAAGDDAPGGDFEIYRASPGHTPRFGARHQTPRRGLALARSAPYRAGLLAVWLNTPRSITAISPRAPSPWPVRFVGLPVQMPAPLFSLPAHAPTFWGWLLGRAG